MKKEPKITFDELNAAMDEALSLARMKNAAVAPPGYFTSDQYAKHHALSMSASRRHLNELYKDGKLDRVKLVGLMVDGIGRNCFVYGVKKVSKSK